MCGLQDMCLIQIHPTAEGIYAAAKYRDWFYQYDFFLDTDGRVKGKTSNDCWQELSAGATSIIRAKIQNFLAAEPLLA